MSSVGDTMMTTIAVLGGGNGGFATAAYLASKGHTVSLSEHPRFESTLRAVREQGGVMLRGVAGDGLQRVAVRSLSDALHDAGMVIVCVPAFGIEPWAEALASHLRKEHLVVLNGSACGGALRFVRRLRAVDEGARPQVAETASLTFGCRKSGPAEITVLVLVQGAFFAAFPGTATPEAAAAFGTLFQITPCRNVLDTTLNNGNPVSHVPAVVLNAGRIERASGEFYLYTEGITPAVASVMEAVDRERLALCRAVGAPPVTSLERIVKYGYAKPAQDFWATYHNSDVYPAVKGPASLDERYLTEDVSFGLGVWSSLGRALGVATPHIDALILLAATLLGKRLPQPLGLSDLGLEGMDAARMIEFVMRGT